MKREKLKGTAVPRLTMILAVALVFSGIYIAILYKQNMELLNDASLSQSREETILRLEKEMSDIESDNSVLKEKVEKYEDPGHGFKKHGALKVVDGRLLNKDNEPVQLRGMSTHGLMWYPEYTNARAARTIYDYGGNVIRIALYSDQNDGYIHRQEDATNALFMAIENALSVDTYVIVDWHILMDENPNTNADAALELFQKVSSHYGDNKQILYEICNEPNGATTWDDVRKYADRVIPVIRSNAPNAVILVGTPSHCTDLSGPLENPLSYENIMYSYHQYTATMDKYYSKMLDAAMEKKLPIFVSEWGVSEKTGSGKVALDTAQEFINYLNKHGISWVNWSLSNKDETSAALNPRTQSLSGWSMDELSPSGRLAFENLAGLK